MITGIRSLPRVGSKDNVQGEDEGAAFGPQNPSSSSWLVTSCGLEDSRRFDIDTFQSHLQGVLIWRNGEGCRAINELIIDQAFEAHGEVLHAVFLAEMLPEFLGD